MLKWIKRLFGLDYSEVTAITHNGIGYSGISSPTVEDVIMNTPSAEVSSAATVSEEKPVKEKKLRKPAVKKAAPKKAKKKK